MSRLNSVTSLNYGAWLMHMCRCNPACAIILHEENGGACGSLCCCLTINRSKAINQTLPGSSLATQDYTNRHNTIVAFPSTNQNLLWIVKRETVPETETNQVTKTSTHTLRLMQQLIDLLILGTFQQHLNV